MARKRKLQSKPTGAVQPPKKQQQQHKLKEEDRTHFQAEEDPENVEYEEEEEEEEAEEEEEDDEEEEEEEDPYKLQIADNQLANTSGSTSAAPATSGRDRCGEDDDDELIQKVLEPFSKDQIINLLCEAAHKHPDVADRIRKVADEDPVQRKIFVHGLGWDTNADTLSNVFKQFGEIEDCKAVCDKVSGKSKGYGFVLFKTRSGARMALKQPQKKIGNRMTACQLASIGPVPQPSATAAAPTPPLSEYTLKKIYVSNVGADLDAQKLLTFFSKYGEIEEGPLGLDKVTGKPKGFCLFVYRTVESAKKALEEPHKNFEGHVLHCQKAIDGLKPNKSNPHNAQLHRNENPAFVGGAAVAAAAPGHLMAAPPIGAGIGLNPALGQAITALLASQGAGLGLTNLLGTLGSAAAMNPGVPAAAAGHAYTNQANIIGGYGNQGGMQGGYPNQQAGQGGSGRGQHGVVQYGGVPPYMGH
jgi:heterogeneous nuclear ribonucleoprotein A1/A3